jgi:NADH:ubiquinone oxidoreductase subunit 3 (subunit A)
MTLSEVLTAFLPDLLMYSGIFGAGFISQFIFESKQERIVDQKAKDKIIEAPRRIDRIKMIIKHHSYLIFAIVAISIGTIIAYCFNQKVRISDLSWTLLLPSLLVFVFLLYEFMFRYRQIYDDEVDSTYFNLTVVAGVLILMVVNSAFHDARQVKKGKSDAVSFIYADKNIQSNKDTLFIGKTSEFIFMKRLIDDKTLIYKFSSIDQIEIKKYRIE